MFVCFSHQTWAIDVWGCRIYTFRSANTKAKVHSGAPGPFSLTLTTVCLLDAAFAAGNDTLMTWWAERNGWPRRIWRPVCPLLSTRVHFLPLLGNFPTVFHSLWSWSARRDGFVKGSKRGVTSQKQPEADVFGFRRSGSLASNFRPGLQTRPAIRLFSLNYDGFLSPFCECTWKLLNRKFIKIPLSGCYAIFDYNLFPSEAD